MPVREAQLPLPPGQEVNQVGFMRVDLFQPPAPSRLNWMESLALRWRIGYFSAP